MTLAEWLADFPYRPNYLPNGCVIIPDTRDYSLATEGHIEGKINQLLWGLTDYFVSSRRAGSIYLSPRKPQ
jgi:hypothetical protein